MSYKLSNLIKENNRRQQFKAQELLLHIDYFKSLCSIDNDTQNIVLNSTDNSYIVLGPAGSGKTILALSKLYQLELNNHAYRILIYTRALRDFLKSKMEVANFASLNEKIFYINEYEKSLEDENIPLETEYLILDEAQDLSFEELTEYMTHAQNGIFLYGDKNQNIHPKRTKLRDTISEFNDIYQLKIYTLDKIFRFSDSLLKFANCINPNVTSVSCYITEDNHKDSSEKPILIEFDNMYDELNFIKNAISKPEFTNVGILTRNNYHAQKVHEWFLENSDKELDAKYTYKENGREKEYYKLNFTKPLPKILTYHSAKGLEFDRVFIPFCNVEEDVSSHENLGYNYREALYVAFTRAKKGLIISYNLSDESKNIPSYKKISGKSLLLNEINENTYLFKKVGA